MKRNLCLLFGLFFTIITGYAQTLYVAPNGSASNSGTSISAPTTLQHAIATVTAGGTIYLRGGTYHLTSTIVIAEANSGSAGATKNIFAYNGEVPVLSFAGMAVSTSNRGIVLDGSYWHFNGIIIESAGDNGLLLSGHNNTIERCIFRKNNDSGLQLSRYNTSYNSLSQWPSNNLILHCEAYDNKDPDNEDADGFAAKLTSGHGNVFRNCIAHHNIDDGWDLYTKSDTGPIGAVTLENCIAHSNGVLTDGSSSGNGDKNGFKLGGEDIAVNHILRRCIAFNNGKHGFTYNRNTGSIEMTNNTGYGNAERNFNFDGGSSVFKNNLSYLSGSNDRIIGTATAPNYFQGAAGGFTVNASDFVSLSPGANSHPTGNGFLHLANGSDLINAGVSSTGISYNGSAPDLGAIESGAITTSYTLTTTATPSNGGSVSRSPNASSYNAGTVVTLSATAASGYTFTGWSGDASGTSSSITITMNANKTVTANFTSSGGSGSTLRIDDKSGTGTGYCSADGSRQSSYTGADGGYYVNLSNSGGKGITWAVKAGAAGMYTIRWRYANAGSQSATTARLLINGVEVNNAVSFPKTSSWTNWTTTGNTTVNLVAGTNKIRIETIISAEFANIDWIEITGNNPTEAICSGAVGSSSATAGIPLFSAPAIEESEPVIFPNPSSGATTLSFSLAAAQRVTVTVLTGDGKAVQQIANRKFAAGVHRLPINTTNLKAGSYYISINKENGKRIVRSMIVQ